MAAKKTATPDFENFEFEFEGETFTLTREQMDDLDVFMAFATGDVFGAVMRMLGADDWKRMEDAVRTDSGRVPMTKVKAFVDQLAEPLGKFVSSLQQ